MTSKDDTLPQAFIWKRLHSIAGFWLVIYLILHLLTNSQAGLFIGDDGKGFIHGVNSIHELPYLPIIEIAILAIPILIHMVWGIKYLRTGESNSMGAVDGKVPYLPEYPRNRAYTWQRITSWLLVVGIIAHVIHMRVIEYPLSVERGPEHAYMVRVSSDGGLYTLAERIGVTLYNQEQINALTKEIATSDPPANNQEGISSALLEQAQKQEENWLATLQKRPLQEKEVMAVANNFGAVELLMLRDTFKMPIMLVLYTLLVLASCYHAFNGLWTFMVSWGVTLTERSRRLMRLVSNILMVIVAAMGLSAIWLTYWINLKQ